MTSQSAHLRSLVALAALTLCVALGAARLSPHEAIWAQSATISSPEEFPVALGGDTTDGKTSLTSALWRIETTCGIEWKRPFPEVLRRMRSGSCTDSSGKSPSVKVSRSSITEPGWTTPEPVEVKYRFGWKSFTCFVSTKSE